MTLLVKNVPFLCVHFLGVLMLAMALGSSTHAQGIRAMDLRIEGFHPLDEQVAYANPLKGSDPAVLKLNSTLFTDSEAIDFEKRQVTFSRNDKLGFAVWSYHYPELSEYLLGRRHYSLYKGWYDHSARRRTDAVEKRGLPALELVMPVQYPDWAQRILGKEPPKLTIDGQLKLTIGYEVETFPESKSGRTGSKGPIFEQENRFSVRGTIGRVVDINISTNSEESFDVGNQLKNFKVEYKGDGNELEDEVIQEVTAGFTGFSMPGTALSGYSESHEGLFGIRIKSQIGPLELTTIVSSEQGEPEELKISKSSASSASSLVESDLIRYRYFWIDTLYKKQYLGRISGGDTIVGLPAIKTIQVWVQVDQVEKAAGNSDVNKILRFAKTDGEPDVFYKRLTRDVHYEVSPQDGWIRIDSGATITVDATRIGLFVTFDGPGLDDRGDTTFTDEKNSNYDVMRNLWLLKKAPPDSTDPTFGLEWRNVYRGPQGELGEDFKVVVKRIAEGTTDSTHELESTRLFSDILGLTDKKGAVLDRRVPGLIKPVMVFDKQRGLLVLPPFADAVIGQNPFANPDLDKKNTGDSRIVNEKIYLLAKDLKRDNIRDQYRMEITGVTAERQSTFDLGWGVMKNTEKVVAGGVTLERYKDYTIDYDMGTVTLVSKRAQAENDIRITYQREALFVPETKNFFGARGELRLPFISNNAFAAASVLFQRAESRDDVPRIGHEPYNKLLLDINTKMDWEPTWMTKLVDLIPLIKTQATSRIDLEIEVAHSRMNPNTSESKEAYIDDFEASKQVTPLGDSYKSWFRASPPVPILDSLLTRPMAWYDYWFNPHSSDEKHRIEKNLIWKLEGDPQSSQDKYESVLKLVVQLRPKPVDNPVDTLVDTLSDTLPKNPPLPQISNRYDNPWTGIMTYLSPGLADRSKDKYLEFWVRANVERDPNKSQYNLQNKNSNGVLYVDLGVLSEDISIDGGPPDNKSQPATEDTSGLGYFNIDSDDLGIDFRKDNDEYWVVPNESRTGWDTLRFSDPRLPFPLDPARDNYAYYGIKSLANRSKVNGTELDAETNPGPSTEDINGDGYMDLRHQERYFRYRIDLDSLMDGKGQFIDTTANRNPDGRFYRIRIPLSDTGLVNAIQKASSGTEPSFRDIRGVRFFWSDFDPSDTYNEKQLELTRIQFVGNQWLPRVVRGIDPLAPSAGVVEASVVNNEDDSDYREQFMGGPENGFPFDKDDFLLATKEYKREQSLKMTFSDIQAGDTALIDRWYSYHPFDFSMYKQIKLDVYSKNDHSNDSVRAVLRFGTDSATYYQVSSNVLVGGWRGNQIVCDLKALTDGKLAYSRDTSQGDTINYTSPDGRYQIKASGRSVPNLSRVSWIAVGIVRGGSATSLVEGELWFNNLRVDGTQVLSGSAARGLLRMQWADFMNLSTEFNYQDGDFRKMTETQARAGDSRLDANVAADFKLDKFLPAELGVAIPLGMRASTAVTRPQLAPNSDATLKKDNGDADRLSDMAKDAVDAFLTKRSFRSNNITNAEHYQTTSTARSINTSFDKNVRSDFLPTNLTLDRLSVDGRYNRTDELRHQGARPEEQGDYVDTSITKMYGGDLDYDLSPQDAPKWTRLKPFGESKARWIGSRLKERELTFLPRTLSFNLADNVNYTELRKHTARSGIDDDRKTFTMGHGMRLDYSPISSVIDIGFGTNLSRNFNELLNGENAQSLGSVVDNVFKRDTLWDKFNVLNSETSRKQDASLAFRPQFFDWLTHSFTYSATYSHGFRPSPANKDERVMGVTVDGNFNFDSDFQFGELFRAAAKRMEKVAFANTIFENMRTGFDKVSLRSIRFEYDAGSNLKNSDLERDFMAARINQGDYFLYKLGLLRSDSRMESLQGILDGGYNDKTAFGGMLYRSGNGDDPAGYNSDSRRATQKYSLSTSFKIPGIDLSFNTVKYSWDTSYTVTPDTSRRNESKTNPDLRVSANTPFLNKIDFISKSFQRVNLATGYNYRHTRTVQRSSGQSTQRDTWAQEFSPLFKVDGTLRKRPIRFSYSYSYDRKADKGNTRDVNITSRSNANLNYDIPQAKTKREIKVLKWTVPVEGRTNLGVNLDFSSSKGYIGLTDSTQQRTQLPGGVEPTTESGTFSLKPELTYVFTSKINGKAIFDWTQTTSTTETHRRYVQIAGTVDIKF